MPYIDKILDKDQNLYDIQDTKGRVKIEGTSLVIPADESQREPVFVDPETGVEYYHKKEFDLTAYHDVEQSYDLITGEPNVAEGRSCMIVFTEESYTSIKIIFGISDHGKFDEWIYPQDESGYESQAFTVVDAMDEVDAWRKICLPECSAYYGWISEDCNAFISYYNLKSETLTNVKSIKRGNKVVPIAISSDDATEGQVLMANGQGDAEWSNLPSGNENASQFSGFFTFRIDESKDELTNYTMFVNYISDGHEGIDFHDIDHGISSNQFIVNVLKCIFATQRYVIAQRSQIADSPETKPGMLFIQEKTIGNEKGIIVYWQSGTDYTKIYEDTYTNFASYAEFNSACSISQRFIATNETGSVEI